jgi:lipopolysaccharide/colanic/teichoic acid biosynthesis glycosyltransferase
MSRNEVGTPTAAALRSAAGFDPNKTNTSRAPLLAIAPQQPVGGQVKRAIDVALALITLVVLAPLLVLVAILLRVCLGRPILVAEHCVGFAGKVFTAYNFRTSSEDRARELASDATVATCLASLRDSELHRLPQLLSIMRGDMSFVGPRPVTCDEYSATIWMRTARQSG